MVARDLVLLEEVGRAAPRGARELRGQRGAAPRGEAARARASPPRRRPHHFTLTDAAVEGWNTHAKMNPPLRHPEDVAAVREGLADGTIDAIATDHAPHGIMDKQVPYAEAANGVVGLETALPLTLELVRTGVLDARSVPSSCSPPDPAAAFGLPGGHLAPGAPADVTFVDPGAEWTVDAARFQSKSRNTPYDGLKVTGRVVRTVVGGRTVWPLEERR